MVESSLGVLDNGLEEEGLIIGAMKCVASGMTLSLASIELDGDSGRSDSGSEQNSSFKTEM